MCVTALLSARAWVRPYRTGLGNTADVVSSALVLATCLEEGGIIDDIIAASNFAFVVVYTFGAVRERKGVKGKARGIGELEMEQGLLTHMEQQDGGQ